MCFAPQRRALFPHRNFQKWREHVVLCTCSLRNVLRATTACTFSTSELPKVVRTWCVLYIFTSKCASRHNGVHFFDISTSKSGPTMVCFVHFDFDMCFAPQRRALRHLNCQKWSAPGVFWTCKCASRHNGVQFLISHLASWLRTRHFSEPTFRPSGASNHWKTQCFATFLPFRASASAFFWLFLFSDLLSSTLSLLGQRLQSSKRKWYKNDRNIWASQSAGKTVQRNWTQLTIPPLLGKNRLGNGLVNGNK